MEKTIKECLLPILGKDVSDDIVRYIASMESEEDYEELMDPICDKTNKIHVDMYKKLRIICFSPSASKSKPNRNSLSFRSNTSNQTISSTSSITPAEGKKRIKYSKYDSSSSAAGLKKGRHPCECQTSEHLLINNCTNCGRIVCAQEGSGPCLFCDTMVLTRDEMDIMAANTKESNRLYNHVMEKKKSKEWMKAIENRNTLIKSDQIGIQNKVLDDQNDYFDIHGKWASAAESDNLKTQYLNYQERVHKSRNDLKFALNFASRTVTAESDENDKYKANLLKGVNKILDNSEGRFPPNLFHGDKGQLVSDIVKLMKEQQLTNKLRNEIAVKSDEANASVLRNKYRVANSDFMQTVDKGLCLSMHQPWASLLVAGIKVHEGRTWQTDHRGRLWIAAAAKEPENEEILACEELYRILYNDNTLEFPKKYPTGCLLGCVFLEDCLNQDKYKQKYANGESDCPFVFVCSNPVILPIFYPMQGQHKIFSLNKDLHRTAKAALMTSAKWV